MGRLHSPMGHLDTFLNGHTDHTQPIDSSGQHEHVTWGKGKQNMGEWHKVAVIRPEHIMSRTKIPTQAAIKCNSLPGNMSKGKLSENVFPLNIASKS